MSDGRDLVADGFTETASDYEDAVRFNIEGGQRLVMSIPAGHSEGSKERAASSDWLAQARDVVKLTWPLLLTKV